MGVWCKGKIAKHERILESNRFGDVAPGVNTTLGHKHTHTYVCARTHTCTCTRTDWALHSPSSYPEELATCASDITSNASVAMSHLEGPELQITHMQTNDFLQDSARSTIKWA
uniref:Uncharacterized protein n=1 Tax=Eutreptiella gymnastica TaxID=73025 RepID=A0A7S1IGI6_9EUGL|mmetsp:Transcript_16104/g.28534  ORF Transcript_16104/g.28534 Transcript_16104/m.28534 type:complete len:113 (+) Transcript_16104:579-917(+)